MTEFGILGCFALFCFWFFFFILQQFRESNIMEDVEIEDAEVLRLYWVLSQSTPDCINFSHYSFLQWYNWTDVILLSALFLRQLPTCSGIRSGGEWTLLFFAWYLLAKIKVSKAFCFESEALNGGNIHASMHISKHLLGSSKMQWFATVSSGKRHNTEYEPCENPLWAAQLYCWNEYGTEVWINEIILNSLWNFSCITVWCRGSLSCSHSNKNEKCNKGCSYLLGLLICIYILQFKTCK